MNGSLIRRIVGPMMKNKNSMKNKIGTKEKPLALKTPPLSSEYTMHMSRVRTMQK